MDLLEIIWSLNVKYDSDADVLAVMLSVIG